jgi:hypothetical protein
LSPAAAAADAGLLLAIGKCFSIIAYAQLVAECCSAVRATPAIVSALFHGIIEDLSAGALALSAMFGPKSTQRGQLKRVVKVPRTSSDDLDAVTKLLTARFSS